MGWEDIVKPLGTIEFMGSLLSGGVWDVAEGYKKYQKTGSWFDFLDRAIDPGGTVDQGTRALGEQLPEELRQIAPTAGGAVGSYWGPGGAAAGAGVGSKLAGDDTQTGMQKAGMAAIASYLFGGDAASDMGAGSGASTAVKTGSEAATSEAAVAAAAQAGEAAGAATAEGVGSGTPSMIEKVLSNPLLAKYLTSIGADLMKYGSNTDQGMQYTNTNNVTNQQVQSQQFALLMTQLLSEDESTGKFDKKGATVKPDPNSPLYRSFLNENDFFKADSSLMLGSGADVFSKPRMGKIMETPNQADLQKTRAASGYNPNVKRGSFNAVNPFLGNA